MGALRESSATTPASAKGSRSSTRSAALVPDVDVRPSAEGWSDLAQLIDLRAGLLVAEATMRGALARRESRGCHNRTDFPDLDPALQVNFHTRLDDDGRTVDRGASLSRRYPTSWRRGWTERGSSSVAGRLLE